MLGRYYRFHVYNPTGVSVTVSILGQRYKLASDGSLTWENEGTEFASAAVANGAYGSGATRDNSAGKWIGGTFSISATIASGSPSGNVQVFLQRSTSDTGASWPDNGTGELVCVVPFSATGTKVKNFRI